MVRKSLILGVVFGFFLGARVAAETLFLADMDDMPLAPGLTEIDAERVVFDKPEGRIVRTAAQGAVTQQAVREFYADTLPALGWTTAAGQGRGLQFERERERLEITIEAGPPVLVRFAVQPR